jgi:chorismate mutase/prephenate dehydratase
VRSTAIDRELLALLDRRAAVALEVGELKRAHGLPAYRPDREAAVVESLMRGACGAFPKARVEPVWREIMSACRALEQPTRVAYLGPAGTFSEQAALDHFGSAIEHLACASIDEVFQRTTAGGADFGVVPVENSSEGVVTRSLDLFLSTPLVVVAETSLLVRHHLLRATPSLDGIAVVSAHPQALAQCQAWLGAHLPGAERRAVSSNAEGARLAAGDPSMAALAGDRAASRFGLHTVAAAVQDDAHNRTRFAIVARPDTLQPTSPSGRDCTSLVVAVDNRPGAVHDLLAPLKAHGVSMTRFESRPARSGQWEYHFYIDIAGHPDDPPVAAALEELRRQCTFWKVLGSYPVR